MRSEFLNKFFPPGCTNALMRTIQNFSEKLGESFTTVWERYKEIIHAIPHHGFDIGQIVAYFHQGLSLYSKQYIQMMSGGQLYEKSPEEVMQCFDRKLEPLNRKLEAIEMQKVNEVTTVSKVPSAPMGPRMENLCIICDDPTHLTTYCPNLPQVKGAVRIEQANALNYPRMPFNSPYSETYNPRWSKHPNFR